MKMNILGEIWKANKWGFLTSGIIITLGCLFLHVKHHSPLEITIPLGWLGLGFFMFMFGFIMGDDN